MTQQRPTERLRVDVPTLEPDPAFLGMLTHLSAGSQAASPRSTRSTGLRVVVATGFVAVIATATWAAGIPIGGGSPHSPAERPTRIGPSGTTSPGDVGTPHSDVATPGSPLSPGLPGTSTSSSAEHATDPDGAGGGRDPGGQGGPDSKGDGQDGRGQGGQGAGPGSSDGSPGKGKAKGHDKDKARGKAKGHDREPGPGGPRGSAGSDSSDSSDSSGDRGGADGAVAPTGDQDHDSDQQRPTH
ncbi:hypothetical protein RB608_18315 [Nocardioides sp. LHD-245]|uniref:hypothetical protein n=1 Tax=Nocardioides sp. LHD-245 TaxID=3051387 RepID=UPI0027DF2FCD|nr:hypothetical protein [Nocardioides sp. LHD-245]